MAEAIGSISIKGFEIDVVMIGEMKWTVGAHSIAESSACPKCQQQSGNVHKYYSRIVRDLPVDGLAVDLMLQVRRMKCLNKNCAQKTFAERLFGLVEAHAQRTIRFTEALRAIGFAMNCEAGAALYDYPQNLDKKRPQNRVERRPSKGHDEKAIYSTVQSRSGTRVAA